MRSRWWLGVLVASVVQVGWGCGDLAPVATTSSDDLKTSASPVCVTLRRGKTAGVVDAFVKSNEPTKNFGARPTLRVSRNEESLLAFDVSSIPASASVTRASLKLFVSGENGDGTVRLHRVLAPWTEAGVTYRSFRQSFDDDTLAAFRVESRSAVKSADLTRLVAGWVSRTAANNGVVLVAGPDHHGRCDRDGDDDRDPTVFASSESSDADKRPTMEVCYVPVIDRCEPNPCAHGGVCNSTASGYACRCLPGFSGPRCEANDDDCAAAPCRNGGICVDGVNGFACTCPPGFSGTTCETNLDDCAPNPCLNGGVCSDGVASHSCACPSGFGGADCEMRLESCDSAPCHNGGACITTSTGYRCACVPGFSGPTCDTNVDECVGTPCAHGTCVDGIAAFTCACSPGWGGPRCAESLDSCVEGPCLNGGVCSSAAGAYICACPPGYAGLNCEIDIDACSPNPCSNGGVCVDLTDMFLCECPAGYSGTTCAVAPCGGACAGTASPVCDLSTGACVQCLVDAHCPAGVACDSVTHVCGIPGPQPNVGLEEQPPPVTAPCPLGMALVDSVLCMDQYEAALLEVMVDGSTHPWSPYHDPGPVRRVRAVSLAGAVPQAHVSERQAEAACDMAGKRLCTDAEWLRACRGADGTNLYPYGAAPISLACNDSAGGTLALTGQYAVCASPELIYDLVGNLGEWSMDQAGTYRGGDYVHGQGDGTGCLARNTAHDVSFSSDTVGFRCCFDPF